MKVVIKYFLILCILPLCATGQVYLSGLSTNPVLKCYIKNSDRQPSSKSSAAGSEALRLPFMDDFSYDGPYPNPMKWLDSNVYINAHYPVFPVDYGVATFDVLNDTGGIYSQASIFPFIADYLTSYPIRLDSVFDDSQDTSWKISSADSLYFSFYYQPQGRGDVPLGYDSLSLQFGFTDTIFSAIDYTWLKISDAFNSSGIQYADGDTIWPQDTILYSGCEFNYIISLDTLYYSDSVNVACDSVFVPETSWKYVWNNAGEALDTFLIENNVYFKLVMIPITDTIWYRKDFQFRFYNYGSLSSINSWKSNTDHWHIDKVYLNTGRTMNDIFTREIKFVEPIGSVLNLYSSMPMYHFNPNLVKETITAYANNNDSIGHECTYSFAAQDEAGNYLPGFTGGYTGVLGPYYLQEVSSNQPFAQALVENAIDPQASQEVTFTISHMIRDNEDAAIVDTIFYKQVFSNYFAYDDGTAERSYGASADNTHIAVQFKSYEVDTLRGVQIFFNRVLENYNYEFFHIGVWNDNNGKPGSLIYQQKKELPDLTKINEFNTYIFEDTIIRLGVYNYYVGVTQTTFDNLNIGFDRNTNTKSRTFYNTSGTWITSPFDGSLMIRPVVGKALVETGPEPKSQPEQLEIYPNPPVNSDRINFVLPSWASSPDYWKYFTTRIYNLSGRILFAAPFEDQISISGLEPGFYIIDILDEAFTKHYTTKLLITK